MKFPRVSLSSGICAESKEDGVFSVVWTEVFMLFIDLNLHQHACCSLCFEKEVGVIQERRRWKYRRSINGVFQLNISILELLHWLIYWLLTMEFCKNQNSMDQLSNHSPKIMKHPLYHQKSVPWLDLRVFYLRISNIKVDDATPEKLKLVHTPLGPDTILEVNGRRSIAYSKSVTSQLRRDRVDKKHEEATFVNTDSVKMTGSVRFELYDGDELMLSGKLESYDDHGFTGEAKEKGKRWKIRCQSHISKAKQWDCSEMILPTIEVYAAGCFSGSPIILTKTLQFGLSEKIDRKMILDSIWDYESSDLNKNEPLDFVENSGLNKLQHTDDYNQKKSYYETSDYIEDDDDDGELSWFNAGVRVGVGIGLGVCVGVGLGVGLLVRTYQATSRNFKTRLF